MKPFASNFGSSVIASSPPSSRPISWDRSSAGVSTSDAVPNEPHDSAALRDEDLPVWRRTRCRKEARRPSATGDRFSLHLFGCDEKLRRDGEPRRAAGHHTKRRRPRAFDRGGSIDHERRELERVRAVAHVRQRGAAVEVRAHWPRAHSSRPTSVIRLPST